MFENEKFLPGKVALTVVIAVKEIWLLKGKPSISPSIANLWQFWELSDLLPETCQP